MLALRQYSPGISLFSNHPFSRPSLTQTIGCNVSSLNDSELLKYALTLLAGVPTVADATLLVQR